MLTLSLRGVAATAFVLMLAAPPAPASAQDVGVIPLPVVELSGGYTFMRDFSDDLPEKVNFPAGWYVSTAVNLNTWFALVGEATGSYKNNFDVDVEGLVFSNKARVYTFMGGPRFGHKSGRVMPFAQVLAGGAHLRLTTDFPPELAAFQNQVSASDTEFAFQPGGGLSVFITEHLGVRVAADYRCIIDFVGDGENQYSNEFRFLSGFTLNWGAR